MQLLLPKMAILSFEKEMSDLIQDQLLFTESIYANLPVGIEIYDANGILRSINDHALHMYGVEDRTTVIGVVNLFNSPYCDEKLRTKIQAGEDIVLEFEYDFDRINKDAYFSSHNQKSMIYEVKVVPIRSKIRGNYRTYTTCQRCNCRKRSGFSHRRK